jgi:uncharacterized protein DUF5996
MYVGAPVARESSMNEPISHDDRPECWPRLPLAEWRDTCATLHLWTQIVGKVRLALTPLVNHWWNVPLYVGARGLTTSAIPYRGRAFEVRFDFLGHALVLETSEGTERTMPLQSRSVADFHRAFMEMLRAAGIDVTIRNMPAEIPDPIPFDEDHVHATYDPEHAQRFWRILVTVDRMFNQFRSTFIGKCSPVHFFWGSFDLAVTRFSGRRAPARAGADAITREAYSHEVSSVGFWPGSGDIADAAFYSYTSPEPEGFRERAVAPEQAYYDSTLGEYVLMYDDVRNARSPSAALRAFCDSTYAAAADLGGWDRATLER